MTDIITSRFSPWPCDPPRSIAEHRVASISKSTAPELISKSTTIELFSDRVASISKSTAPEPISKSTAPEPSSIQSVFRSAVHPNIICEMDEL